MSGIRAEPTVGLGRGTRAPRLTFPGRLDRGKAGSAPFNWGRGAMELSCLYKHWMVHPNPQKA